MEVELVPQGTLVERCRAGGSDVAAFYTPTSVGTLLTEGKEVREFDGKKYVLEHGIKLDFALLRAYRADRAGNVQIRGGSLNFNPAFAKAAQCAIVEVDEIVETGEIPPELINLPGIFIHRVVKTDVPMDTEALRRTPRRAPDTARVYNGKPGLTRAGIGKRAAGLVAEGTYVNLGTGIPTQVSNYLEDRDVTLHAENGVLGYGKMVAGDNIDLDVYNASGQFVELKPGASFFDSVASFEMARGGKIDTVILGAYEVDQQANVANWSTSDKIRGGIGGAMDLISGAKQLIIVMEHCDSKGRPKLKKHCSYPLTGEGCVDYVVTDLAVMHFVDGRFVVEEVAPGFTAEEVIALTEMENVVPAKTVGTMA
jgi:3-oxoacid CoA-transferase